jgi:hypothetical protein
MQLLHILSSKSVGGVITERLWMSARLFSVVTYVTMLSPLAVVDILSIHRFLSLPKSPIAGASGILQSITYGIGIEAD